MGRPAFVACDAAAESCSPVAGAAACGHCKGTWTTLHQYNTQLKCIRQTSITLRRAYRSQGSVQLTPADHVLDGAIAVFHWQHISEAVCKLQTACMHAFLSAVSSSSCQAMSDVQTAATRSRHHNVVSILSRVVDVISSRSRRRSNCCPVKFDGKNSKVIRLQPLM